MSTQPNQIKKTADYIKRSGIIEDICKSYVYEYLSSFDDESPQDWADKLNILLDEFKDDPGFEFLKQDTEEGVKYKRIKGDKDSYETFKKLQFSLHGTTVAKEFYKKVKDLFTSNDGKEALYDILYNANEVFLEGKPAEPAPGIADIETDNFGGSVTKSVLNWPTEAPSSLNLEGAGIYLFLMYVYQTGWFTKDIVQNNPVNAGATSLPVDRAEQGRGPGNPKFLWFPYMVPTAPKYEITTTPGYTSPRTGIRQESRDVMERTEEAELIGIKNYDIPSVFGDISYLSNAGKITTTTRTTLRADTINEVVFSGLTGGLYDERNGPYSDESTLFYNGGAKEGRGANSSEFESFYGWNLDVMTSIATLYPDVTWGVFKDVLENFVSEVDKNISQAEVILGASEGEVETPFTTKIVKLSPAALKPVDHQCYLLENIRTLASYKDNLTELQKYKNLGAIYGNSLPGNLISYLNHANKDKEVNALLNLCPEIYALLTPHIKIYRIDYEGEDKLTPTEEQEIPFPNFIDPSDIQAIMNSDYGRFPGAGIKSFSWKLDGVNPAEVANNISATLNLHFQTIQDLFSLNQGLAAGQSKPGYLDLIIKSAGKDAKSSNPSSPTKAPGPVSTECFEAQMMDYDPRDYEIKACVGWSTPGNFADIVDQLQSSRDRGPNYGKNLEEAINLTRISLYLTITTHELNFNENGSVDLNINYQARLSGLARSPAANIFSGGCSANTNLPALEKSIKDLESKLEEAIGKFDADNSNQALNDTEVIGLREELKVLLEKKVRITKQDKAIKYKTFLERLYTENKIYNYVVSADDRVLLRDLTPAERSRKARTKVSSNEYQVGWNPQSGAGAAAELYDEAAKQIQELSNSETDEDNGPNVAGAIAKINSRTGASSKNTDLNIPFFYLGDLIDEVLSFVEAIVDRDDSQGSLQLILSQIELLDPLLAYQVKSIELNCPNNKDKQILRALSEVDPMRFRGLTGIQFTTGIGSLPISLELFQEWFINNIVRPQVDNYNILRFIKNICSSLIGRSFNSICFKDLNFNLRFDTSIFNLMNKYAGKITTAEQLASSKKVADEKNCIKLTKGIKPSIPTFILYSVDSRPLTGDYDEDLKNGIYHYYLGASCGIAKKISFSRTNLPYYRESRLQRKSALSALQLREMYNASIDMVGNNLHKNGQYIYVNPIAIGAGSMQQKGDLPNLARLLGIGGYYMISTVSHEISSAGFNVQVDSIQEGIDFSGAGNSITELVPYADQAILNPYNSGN